MSTEKIKKSGRSFSWLPQILCGLMLCFTLFIFAPIDMWVMNSSDFWFKLNHFVPTQLAFFVASFVAVELVLAILRRAPKQLYLLVMALLFGLSLALYIQGNYLCLNNEVLFGGAPNWTKQTGNVMINLCIWAVIIIGVLVFMVLKPKLFMKSVSFACALVLVMEATSLTVSLMNYRTGEDLSRIYTTNKDRLTYSENGDVIVLMIDTVDTRLFDRMLKENPEYADSLHDFTYYHNMAGLFNRTDPSFIGFLTGEICQNQLHFYEFAQRSFRESQFFPTLIDNGYTVNLYGTPNGFFDDDMLSQVDNLSIRDSYLKRPLGFEIMMQKMVAYRYAPLTLQPFMYDEYATRFISYGGFANGTLPSATDDNFELYNALKNSDMTVDNSRRFFKFYKIDGAHKPYNMTRDVKKSEDGSVDIYEEILGTFTIVNEHLRLLKETGAYDDSTIIIMADHGSHDSETNSPTFLIKYPGEAYDEMRVSEAPVSLIDLRATVLYGAGIENYADFGTPVHMWEDTESRERIFYSYDYAKPTGALEFYLKSLEEYIVPEHATDLTNYTRTGNVFEFEKE